MKNIKHIFLALAAIALLNACGPAEGNDTGHEYMPDMGHSIAQEANVYSYYYQNTWDSASTIRLKELAIPGLPVEGTVPRGYAGEYFAKEQGKSGKEVMASLRGEGAVNNISVPVNGHVPYYYEDTESDRERATAELIDNPYPITQEGLTRGQMLYMTFCGICHGTAGDGVGYLVSEDNPNAVYPAAPANFLLDEFVNASNGRYYHAIMYGKNVMGGYADKISYEERWQVIHWIRALQAKEKGVEYTAEANTLNPAFGIPGIQVEQMAEQMSDTEALPEEGEATEENHEDGNHHEGDSHEHGEEGGGGHGDTEDHGHGDK
jgi:mono/diheme cytochrome c family protein